MFFKETLFLYQGPLSIQTLHCIVYTNWLVDFKETIFLYKTRLSIQNLQWAATHIQACLSQLAFCSTRRKAHNHVSERSSSSIRIGFKETLFLYQGRLSIQTLHCIVYTNWRVNLQWAGAHILACLSQLAFCSRRRKALTALWERTLGAHIRGAH